MGDDLLVRLRRLGVTKGTRNLKPAPRVLDSDDTADQVEEAALSEDSTRMNLQTLFPGGRLEETPYGSCFVLDTVYPLTHRHGHLPLSALKDVSLASPALAAQDLRLATLDYRQLLFLDTETTGLISAATLAFMVGVAFADDQALVVRQFFLRDHGDERAMLYLLDQLMLERVALVTFNGCSFDLPLLDGRYFLNGLEEAPGERLVDRPHIDLLFQARRLWRRRLVSCSFKSLEDHVLGVRRSTKDIPGSEIPGYYLDYLRTGDASPLDGVFYHNKIDMLSMVTLLALITGQFDDPQAIDQPMDLFSLARWQLDLGLAVEAEQSLRLALKQDPPLALYQQLLLELAMLLKRSGRREEAVPLWQQVAVTSFDQVEAHVELAKHYEWQIQDLGAARRWTVEALDLVAAIYNADDGLLAELEHRLSRLERKAASHAQS